MSFLAPLFLLGALAIALPIVFHLVRRTTRERTLFGSLMFLRPAPPRLTRRNRIEHWLLLLLRALAVMLLAFGFARPFLRQALPEAMPTQPDQQVVVLVDVSASMQRGDLWVAAREQALRLLRGLKPGDEAALLFFGRSPELTISFQQWRQTPPGERAALAEALLQSRRPGWSATHLDSALAYAAELLATAEDGRAAARRRIVLISDLQEGSRLAVLQQREWPRGIEVQLEPVELSRKSNAGLHLAAETPASASKPAAPDSPVEPTVRLRVMNAPDATREQFQVGWVDTGGRWAGPKTEVYVPAGQSRILKLPLPPDPSRANRIELRGDDEPFDNIVHFAPPSRLELLVLYAGHDSADEKRRPLYFLERVFREDTLRAVRVKPVGAGESWSGEALQRAALVVVTRPLQSAEAATLRAWLRSGHVLLAAPVSVEAARSLAQLAETAPWSVEEVRPDDYAMLGEIDFRHPLFAPFADPRFSDFTHIHFWRYRRVDAQAWPDAHVLARFDNGDPAVVEIPVGRGRIMFWASAWHPADSQLALSTKFVPLLYALLEMSGEAELRPTQYLVGDTLAVRPPAASGERAEATLVRPDGRAMRIAPSEAQPVRLDEPGTYELVWGTNRQVFAVNLDPSESRTRPMPADELERLGVPVGNAAAATRAAQASALHHLRNAELESRQKLWRWFLVATLTVLLLETWLAGWTSRRRPSMAEGVP